MQDRFRVFVCEFITGGGLGPEPLPAGLAAEGERMLAALLADLGTLPGVEVVTSRDSRLTPLPGATVRWIAPGEDPWPVWMALIEDTEASWPIAPETGGVLERLSQAVLDADRCLLGAGPEAVRIAASKLRCSSHLEQSGVAVVPTVDEGAEPPASTQGWVVKPDDGAGCEDTHYLPDREALRACLARPSACRRVVQPWVEGMPASISMLCRGGQVRLLACNAQRVARRGGLLQAQGVDTGALETQRSRLEPIAAAVAQALPGLWGYVGADLIVDDHRVLVLEVNPRLTAAYAGLRRALGCNPAALVLNLLREDALPAAVPEAQAARVPAA